MKIGSLQKVSLIDYPGKISAVVFSQGCNFRCPYCHNPELVSHTLYRECVPEELIFSYLEKRRGKVEAVAITGGEPTMQDDLPRFAGDVKDMGFLLKVDTNGSHPEVLEELLTNNLVDYIAMDIKGPLKKYDSITRVSNSGRKIKKSIEIIMNSGIDSEFRTTIVKSQLNESDILAIGKMIENAKLYALQSFNNTKPLDKDFHTETSLGREEFVSLKKKLERKISTVVIR